MINQQFVRKHSILQNSFKAHFKTKINRPVSISLIRKMTNNITLKKCIDLKQHQKKKNILIGRVRSIIFVGEVTSSQILNTAMEIF